MQNQAVLVLNRSYVPINITNLRRAFSMMYRGVANAIDHQFQTFDFESWKELALAENERGIGLVDRMIKIPKVVILQSYDRLPRQTVRFSRLNIYIRDNNTCQYCGKKYPRSELTLDHVIPRSQNGQSEWENVVCCCVPCNIKKGGRGLKEARMKLIAPPRKPRWTPYINSSLSNIIRKEWLPYLNLVDAAYWNTELQRD